MEWLYTLKGDHKQSGQMLGQTSFYPNAGETLVRSDQCRGMEPITASHPVGYSTHYLTRHSRYLSLYVSVVYIGIDCMPVI